eukprot:629571-Prorocentrum_minimum.AAC.2
MHHSSGAPIVHHARAGVSLDRRALRPLRRLRLDALQEARGAGARGALFTSTGAPPPRPPGSPSLGTPRVTASDAAASISAPATAAAVVAKLTDEASNLPSRRWFDSPAGAGNFATGPPTSPTGASAAATTAGGGVPAAACRPDERGGPRPPLRWGRIDAAALCGSWAPARPAAAAAGPPPGVHAPLPAGEGAGRPAPLAPSARVDGPAGRALS